MNPDDPNLMTINEVARYLRLSRASVYRLLREEGLASVRVGAHQRILRADLEAWLDERKVGKR